jgi:hypothetical protein
VVDIKGNSQGALAFLRQWAPQGPWVLNAIDPERKKSLIAQTFDPSSERECLTFIEHWNGKRNLYFLVNVPREALATKAKKDDIGWMIAVHVDVDPEDGKPIEEERERIVAALSSYKPEPSVIIFSGGGYQGFWLLREPVDVDKNIEALEAYNKKPEADLTGALKCYNLDRIMRLPGTINVPDAAKLKRGRVPMLAELVKADWHKVYELTDFEPYKEEKKSKSKKKKADDWLDRVIANGPDHEGPRSYGGDRSKALWAVCTALVRRNTSVDDIVTIITDRKNKISEHIYDQSSPEKYARRQAEKAFEEAMGEFSFNEKGFPHPSQENVRVALKMLEVTLHYDEFARRILMEGPDGLPRRRVEDRELNGLYLRIAREFNFRPSIDIFRMMIADECYLRPFHPLKNYLDGLKWDGIERLDTWLVRHAKAKDTPFVRAVSAISLIAAVRRVRQPGCKFDEIVVLEGPQGYNKSTALSLLAVKPEWFTDSVPLNAKDKELIEALEGKWIVESPELKGMKKSEVEHQKAMLSRQYDRSRLSYGHFSTELPRQCIFFGTTNADSYLRDTTGNRRFWPIKVDRIDVQALKEEVSALWAEAVFREAKGESIRLDPELYAEAALEQERREIEDPWEADMERSLNGYNTGKILSADVWNVINVPQHMRTQEHNARIGEIMRNMGWNRKKLRVDGKSSWCYAKGDNLEQTKRIVIYRDENGLRVEREGDIDQAGHFPPD